MILEVEPNPNFEGSYFIRLKELGPPRRITHIKSYDTHAQGEWCSVTGWCDDADQAVCPAFAQPVEDSGSGSSYVIFGGNWGIRLKSETHKEDWDLYDPHQWGEGYLLLAEARDIRYDRNSENP